MLMSRLRDEAVTKKKRGEQPSTSERRSNNVAH
jgi:hypothetical protein